MLAKLVFSSWGYIIPTVRVLSCQPRCDVRGRRRWHARLHPATFSHALDLSQGGRHGNIRAIWKRSDVFVRRARRSPEMWRSHLEWQLTPSWLRVLIAGWLVGSLVVFQQGDDRIVSWIGEKSVSACNREKTLWKQCQCKPCFFLWIWISLICQVCTEKTTFYWKKQTRNWE